MTPVILQREGNTNFLNKILVFILKQGEEEEIENKGSFSL
jgi:hypothetical protein